MLLEALADAFESSLFFAALQRAPAGVVGWSPGATIDSAKLWESR
jgi:hypothetical protein